MYKVGGKNTLEHSNIQVLYTAEEIDASKRHCMSWLRRIETQKSIPMYGQLVNLFKTLEKDDGFYCELQHSYSLSCTYNL